VKSRNSSHCNETFLVIAVRPGKKFSFQSAAENLQRWWWPDCLRQTVPDRCSSCWKGAVASGRMHSAWSDQRWCSWRAQLSTCIEVWDTLSWWHGIAVMGCVQSMELQYTGPS